MTLWLANKQRNSQRANQMRHLNGAKFGSAPDQFRAKTAMILKMALFSTWNLLRSTLLAFAKKAIGRNLDTFHQQKNSSSFIGRYFQSNIETCWSDIIQKRRTSFYGDKNLILVVIFCGIIHTFRHWSKTYLRIGLGFWRQPPNESIEVRYL